jgi:putative cardiolipin synthase
MSGCASLPTDVERAPGFFIEETSDTKLGKRLAPKIKAHPGKSGFYALADGESAFAARVALIKDAEKSLDVQYYIWHDDLTGKVLHNLLLKAADRGVRVRLLLDDLDTAGKDQMLHIIDAHPNIEIRLYNPFANRSKRFGDYVGDTSRINHRMHIKTITADNQATIFGGRNIGDEYFDATEEVGFSDLDALGVGPIVGEVSQQFDLYWNSQWVYPLAVFKPEQPVTDEMITNFRQQSDAYLAEASTSDYAITVREMVLAKQIINRELDFEWGRWVLVYDHPGKVDAETVNIDTHLAPKLKIAMDVTEKELLIVSPYFVPGKNFTKYLVGLEEKGIQVHIMTNSLAANDVSLVHAGYMRYREELIRGGVDLYEFKTRKVDQNKDKEKKGPWVGASRGSLHAKYFAFDERYVFIGSFNLDPRSVALNAELGTYFESVNYAKRIHDGFHTKAPVVGYKVTLDENDELLWTTIEYGEAVVFDVEPDTGFWKRFSTDFLSIIVPESQL